MTPAYLTPDEAAGLLAVSRRTVLRRVAAGQLPALRVTARKVRIEARALVDGAPTPVPHCPVEVGTSWIARTFRVDSRVIRRLAESGELPMRRWGRHWLTSRAQLLTWINDRSTGEDLP